MTVVGSGVVADYLAKALSIDLHITKQIQVNSQVEKFSC